MLLQQRRTPRSVAHDQEMDVWLLAQQRGGIQDDLQALREAQYAAIDDQEPVLDPQISS
jgi:hypothetical protein